jgi:hypothetical protein
LSIPLVCSPLLGQLLSIIIFAAVTPCVVRAVIKFVGVIVKRPWCIIQAANCSSDDADVITGGVFAATVVAGRAGDGSDEAVDAIYNITWMYKHN